MFEVRPLATGLKAPVAIEYAPDGRLFVGEVGGTVRIVENGEVREPPFAQLDVYADNENGLLGLALDPGFVTNHFVYVFASISNSEQHIIRFTERDGIGEQPVVIRRNLPTSGDFHAGGGLRFGPDGMLYFSIGDNQNRDLAQDMSSLAGKVCRVNPDGSAAADNPFTTPTGAKSAIYALGFRNPFRFCFAPDGRLFVMDVGSDDPVRREEINLIRAGDNAGWPLVEGFPNAEESTQFVEPIYAYHEEGAAPCGAVYYTGAQFPARFANNLFHVEYVLNRVYRVVLDGDTVVSHIVFVQGEGGPVDLTLGPDGSLVYCEVLSGKIKQIAYIGSQSAGGAADDASGSDGGTPSGNSDPDVVNEPPRVQLCGFGAAGAVAFAAGVLCLRAGRSRLTAGHFG